MMDGPKSRVQKPPFSWMVLVKLLRIYREKMTMGEMKNKTHAAKIQLRSPCAVHERLAVRGDRR